MRRSCETNDYRFPFFFQDAAVALLKRKSPPEIVTTTGPDDVRAKHRNVHFTKRNAPNDDEAMYPFDVTDVPYGVIVNQDYENFSKIANGSYTESSSNGQDRRTRPEAVPALQCNRSQTLPTGSIHPKETNPYESRYTNRRNRFKNRFNDVETIQLNELGPTDVRGSFGAHAPPPSEERRRGATRPNHLSGVSDAQRLVEPSAESIVPRGHRSTDGKKALRHPSVSSQSSTGQKRPHKRLLSHEAEKKLHLRERTRPVGTGVMSD